MKHDNKHTILRKSLVDAASENFDELKNHLAKYWPEEQAAAIAKKELIAAITSLLNEWS